MRMLFCSLTLAPVIRVPLPRGLRAFACGFIDVTALSVAGLLASDETILDPSKTSYFKSALGGTSIGPVRVVSRALTTSYQSRSHRRHGAFKLSGPVLTLLITQLAGQLLLRLRHHRSVSSAGESSLQPVLALMSEIC